MYEITGPRLVYAFSMAATYLILTGAFLLGAGETVPPTCNIIDPFFYIAVLLAMLMLMRNIPYDDMDDMSIYPGLSLIMGEDSRVSLPKLALLVVIAALISAVLLFIIRPVFCAVF